MVDRALARAIIEVAEDLDQPESVSRRLNAWLREMSNGELTSEDNERFLIGVCNAIRLEDEDAG